MGEVDLQLDKEQLSGLGQARKIATTKESVTIIGGVGETKGIGSRIAEITAQIEKASSDYNGKMPACSPPTWRPGGFHDELMRRVSFCGGSSCSLSVWGGLPDQQDS